MTTRNAVKHAFLIIASKSAKGYSFDTLIQTLL